jgi:hypothetical protein
MNINGQPAQVRPEDKGSTVRYMGSTFVPSKVSFLSPATGEMLDKLPSGEYHDAIISGILDSKKEELTITSIRLCRY